MEDNYYLELPNSGNSIFESKEIVSFPFPSNSIPKLLSSRYLFVEKVEDYLFLRNIKNKNFCIPIEWQVNKISINSYDEDLNLKVDLNGERLVEEVQVSYLAAYFQNELRAVAYNFKNQSEWLLPLYKTEKKLVDLGVKLNELYDGALWQRRHYLFWDEEETIKHANEKLLRNNNLQPIGKWENSMFEDVFNSNPKLMTDNEFEMIFGVTR